jgi:NADH-quinone oxidoreductase subunit C
MSRSSNGSAPGGAAAAASDGESGMNRALEAKVDAVFRGVETELADDGRLTVRVPRDSVVPVLRFLKEEGVDFLQLVSCVDWVERLAFEIVYVLSSYVGEGNPPGAVGAGVVVKAELPREGASLASSIGVFPAAEPYERELHELFGVHFEGHPRLTPLFLEREYEVPPFRKDFDTRKYVEDHFGRIPPVEEGS